MQSVPITTNVVSSNPAHDHIGEVFLIQHYVGFFPVSSSNQIDRHDITEILLKVTLNTITPNPIISSSFSYPLFHIFFIDVPVPNQQR